MNETAEKIKKYVGIEAYFCYILGHSQGVVETKRRFD